MEAAEFSYGLRGGPFFDGPSFLRIYMNLISSNHESQKYNILLQKVHFSRLAKR